VRGAAKNAVPDVLKERAYYEGLNWWFVMARIGQGLRVEYKLPTEFPPKLLALIRKLDDSDLLFPALSWRNDVDFFP
jgi:hypothetical protein